jgi:alpha-mannosidase
VVTDRLLWSIGAPDGRSPELVDNYREPGCLGDVLWRVSAGPGEPVNDDPSTVGTSSAALEVPTVLRFGFDAAPARRSPPDEQVRTQHWPLFHPSEADPEGGYRLHPYIIEFTLDHDPATAYRLCLQYLVIAPRLAHLEIAINGVSGCAYLRPRPSRSGEIRLHAGLHTSIYAEGVCEVIIPGVLLRRGESRLVLTARDGGEVVHVENIERIRRLDRMANGAGFIYQHLTFTELSAPPESLVSRGMIEPSVIYRRDAEGRLLERCHLYLELAHSIPATEVRLSLDDGELRVGRRLPVPAAAFGHVHVPFDLPDGESEVAYELTAQLAGESLQASGTFRRARKWKVFVAPHVHTDIGYTHRQWEVAERLCRVIDAALNLMASEGNARTGPAPDTLERHDVGRGREAVAPPPPFVNDQARGNPHACGGNSSQRYGPQDQQAVPAREGAAGQLLRGPALQNGTVEGADALYPEVDSSTVPAFSFHLDSSWALEAYLATREPERRQQLIAAIRAGRFGVAASYVDLLTQFAGREDLIRNAEFTERVLRPEGLSSDFTTAVDVASLTGSYPALLAEAGVRYLVHANNQDRGPFRLNGGLHRASPYYWEGTTGGRVLVWLAKMYCEVRKVCGSPPLLSSAERGLPLWLDEYERPEYLPDAVLLYGQEADNTDLDPQPAEFVRCWNETYAYPRLIPCAVSQFFQYVEEHWGDRLPVVRGDGGAYWEDGVLSHLPSTVRVRAAQAMLPAAETLESLAVLHQPGWAYPLEQYEEAWRQVLLFDEHTWGAFLSAVDPDALLQRDLWSVKEHMAESAAQWAQRLLHGAAVRHSLQWNTDGRELVVYNPHSWTVSGPARMEVGRGEIPIDAETGRAIPHRQIGESTTQRQIELWVEELPGLSYRRVPLRPAGAENRARGVCSRGLSSPFTLESAHYRLTLDPEQGCVTSWFDKDLGRELVDRATPWGLGGFLYAEGGEGTRLVSNQADLPEGNPQLLADFRLTGCTLDEHPLGRTARLCGAVPAGTLEVEWTLPKEARHVDVRYTYHKEERRTKEAAYIAFPLALPGAEVLSDSQLGWVDWGRDELPGGCKEWLPLQTGILARADGAQVLICSPDVPLFCVGDIVRGRWPKEMELSGGRLFSYVLNNYWHTNYRGSQGGDMRFGYRLVSDWVIEPDRAYRTGWTLRRPLYAHRVSFQDFRAPRMPYADRRQGTFARIGSECVVVSTIKQARWADGFIVRLLEISGQKQKGVPISVPARRIRRAWRCDLLEHDGEELRVEGDGTLRLDVPAWGLSTTRIVTGREEDGPL